MRRALGLALTLAALAVPSPAAAAMVPPPTYIDFESASGSNPTIGDARFFAECGTRVTTGAGNSGTRYLAVLCTPATIAFDQTLQSEVSLFSRLPAGAPAATITLTAYDLQGLPIASTPANPTPGQWTAIVVRDPSGGAGISRVDIDTDPDASIEVDVDDVGFSTTPQPDTEITGGPGSGDPTFIFEGNQGQMTFSCRLDGGPAEPCSSPKAYPGLADGGHTFEVTGTDRWGSADATPASQRFVFTRPAPVADRDADGVVDGSDNCPDSANAAQGDADADGVGDACEVLASGNAPLEAGRAVKVRLLSGEVFVKLPPGATGSAFTTGLRVPFQSSGFVSLKGVASVPIGSTLDTRSGAVALTAAVNGQRPSSPRQLRREARFRAGIFAIRQARKARRAKRSKRIPPRAELASPPGAERPCRASGPAKGTTVRSLVTTAKGVFRTVGGAATATPAKGTSTFITTDRCDGTVTEVGRGRVAVIAKKSGKRQVVRSGRAYLVRARLFAARKGRRG